MGYLEYKFIIEPYDRDLSDILIAFLSEEGFDSFVENSDGLLAYIDDSQDIIDRVNSILQNLSSQSEINFSVNYIEKQNWNILWESNFEPVFIDHQVAILAPFHQPEREYKYTLIIEPKMSFGTGHHETTMLMIENMLQLNFKNSSVLDMGCGTGVLAIFASKLGASDILAIDIDEWAVDNSVENCKRNNATEISVLKGDASAIPPRTFDFILANINKNVLIQDIPLYVNHLNRNATVLLSGFYEDDIVDIENICKSNHLKRTMVRSKNRWVSMAFQL
jgi:ribosomal protein L11 methyltransferase